MGVIKDMYLLDSKAQKKPRVGLRLQFQRTNLSKIFSFVAAYIQDWPLSGYVLRLKFLKPSVLLNSDSEDFKVILKT